MGVLRGLSKPLVILIAAAACAVLLLNGPDSQAAGEPGIGTPTFDMVFNDTAPGQTSAEQFVSLYSTGTATLTISKVSFTGVNPGDFVVSNDACTGVPLAPNSHCDVGMRFTPTATGTRVAKLKVESNTNCTVWIHVAGGGFTSSTRSSACGHVTVITETATPNPTSTATVTATPTPGGGVLGENQSGGAACPGRKTVKIHFHTNVGDRIAKAHATVAGRKFKVKQVKHRTGALRGYYTSTLNFKGLLKSRYHVRVRGTLTNGKRFKRDRIFVNCVNGARSFVTSG